MDSLICSSFYKIKAVRKDPVSDFIETSDLNDDKLTDPFYSETGCV